MFIPDLADIRRIRKTVYKFSSFRERCVQFQLYFQSNRSYNYEYQKKC